MRVSTIQRHQGAAQHSAAPFILLTEGLRARRGGGLQGAKAASTRHRLPIPGPDPSLTLLLPCPWLLPPSSQVHLFD